MEKTRSTLRMEVKGPMSLAGGSGMQSLARKGTREKEEEQDREANSTSWAGPPLKCSRAGRR